jgi:hypothetical protein
MQAWRIAPKYRLKKLPELLIASEGLRYRILLGRYGILCATLPSFSNWPIAPNPNARLKSTLRQTQN